MTTFPIRLTALALFAFVAVIGCGPSGAAPESVPLTEAPGKVKQAFDRSAADVKKAADDASQALADGAYDVSLGRLADLSSRTDLSAEQRQALAQSRIAVMKKLQEQAAAGDAKANQIMELHRASK